MLTLNVVIIIVTWSIFIFPTSFSKRIKRSIRKKMMLLRAPRNRVGNQQIRANQKSKLFHTIVSLLVLEAIEKG